MKRLLVVIVVAGALWSGYWVVAMRGAMAGFEAWFAARRAEGWQADYAALTVRGYPNRIDTTFDRPALADPETGLAWEAPFFQIFALSYKPNHIIAVWPDIQRFSTPRAKYMISSADMRASLVMAPDPTLALQRSNLVAGAIAIEGPDGTTTLEGLQAAVGLSDGAVQDYRIAINSDGFAPPAPTGLTLRTGGRLPHRFDALRADLSVAFDKPWDLTALEERRPQPRTIRLKLAEAKWGELELALAGQLAVDAAGRPNGRLTVKARNWRDIIALARAGRWLPASWLDPIEEALTLTAQLSGNSQTLDLPLDFKNGTMSLGPFPLGAAPVLQIR
ncbi:DUF2125 domain-containing protein [Marimonas arenosa]|uniref:DUF2125 domain-containing protein n=1 Tax=Marimonas arenosa TaxID=1795305 RepID=A0AAE4B6C3_9RHOB|nr:DUF2125 domain-containing protein [Marimonas arenosa]MDQ2092017.1 DUF2125 domain-containing protein [Marimonas arenosa]